jgi:hypothetical protein
VYKALTDELLTEGGINHPDLWGGAILRIDSLAAEVATAESLTKRLAAEAQEKEVRNLHCNAWNTDANCSLEIISEERKPASIQCSLSSPKG